MYFLYRILFIFSCAVCSFFTYAGGEKSLSVEAEIPPVNGLLLKAYAPLTSQEQDERVITFVPTEHTTSLSSFSEEYHSVLSGSADVLLLEKRENGLCVTREQGGFKLETSTSLLGASIKKSSQLFSEANIKYDPEGHYGILRAYDILTKIFDQARQENRLVSSPWKFPDTVPTVFQVLVKAFNAILVHSQLDPFTVLLPEKDKEYTTQPGYLALAFSILTELDLQHICEQLSALGEKEIVQQLQEQIFLPFGDQEFPGCMDDEIGHLLGHTEETGIETDKEMEASICPWLFTINELGSAFSFDTQRVDLSCLTSLTKLSALLDSALGTHVLMHKYSLQKRNQLWATRYSTLFERFPGKRIVAVHGAGHFVGKGNIIDLLKQQGWRWEIYDYNRHAFVALSRQ